MLKEERQRRILEGLYTAGQVRVEALSHEFQTSQDTIRRDLSELEEQGLVKRVYGGAIPQKQLPPAIDERQNVERDEKYLIAQKAVRLVRPDTLIAIDGGTTNALFASLLPRSIKLRVVTNSFSAAAKLRANPGVEVIFLGGRYSKSSQVTVGESVLEQLRSYRFDQCFLGAYGVDAEAGVSVSYPYEDEAFLKQYLVDHSAEVHVLCSRSKLGRASNYRICPLSAVDSVICGFPISPEQQARYQGRLV